MHPISPHSCQEPVTSLSVTESSLGILPIQAQAKPTSLEKVLNIATSIFTSLLSFGFYWSRPNFFGVGFILGIICDDQVAIAVDKIKNIAKTQLFELSVLMALALLCTRSASIVIGAVVTSSYMGFKMSYQAQSIIRSREPKPPLIENHRLSRKVWQVVKPLFQGAIGLFLYWTNPYLFAIGFIVGVVSDENFNKIIQKIKDVWETQPYMTSISGSIAAILSLPIVLAGSTIIWAAKFGSRMSQEAQKVCLKAISF